MDWASALTREDILGNIEHYRHEPEFTAWRDSYLAKAVGDLDIEFVEALLAAGAGPDVFESWRDSLQHSLAHQYCANRTAKGAAILKVLDAIFAHGADPNYVGMNNWRAVDYAIEWRMPILVDAFLKHGADPQQREFI